MQRCLELAKKGLGLVAPNPMVGAILVYENQIIGEGFHEYFGGPHAEVNCINSVAEENKNKISQSTLFVSLEPCNHFGKTPPCTDMIIKHRIPNVMIGCMDSFEKVNGMGIRKLREAGVNVVVNVLEDDSKELNKRFFVFHEKKRPYILLKWAQSADKKMNAQSAAPTKISNVFTDRWVHQWRGEEAAIIIGKNTALKDNPRLSNRLSKGNQPIRIFIDKDLEVPGHFHLLGQSVHTLILNSKKCEKINHNEFLKIDFTTSIVGQINEILYQRGISSLIVEGGAQLLNTYITENMWDEARVITNTRLFLETGLDSPVLQNEIFIKRQLITTDSIDFFKNVHH